jgi:glucose/arabinose dehydrogenase
MKRHHSIRPLRPGWLIAGLALAAGLAPAQQVRVRNAPPPINWPSPPLPDGPIVLDTGIQHQIRLVVTKGLNQPWSMAFLPDGGILVTERPGRLRMKRAEARQELRLAGGQLRPLLSRPARQPRPL